MKNLGLLGSDRIDRVKRYDTEVSRITSLRDKFIEDSHQKLLDENKKTDKIEKEEIEEGEQSSQEVNEEETTVYDISSEAEEEK
jgi:hypothetical protein